VTADGPDHGAVSRTWMGHPTTKPLARPSGGPQAAGGCLPMKAGRDTTPTADLTTAAT
jgi:hypothetical protein